MRRRLSILAIAVSLGLGAAAPEGSAEFRKWALGLPANGWKLVQANEATGFAVFAKPPEPKDGRVRLWARYELLKKDDQGMASWVDYYDFDCSGRKMTLLTEVQYRSNNQLEVLRSIDKPGPDQFVIPGTVGESLMNGACAQAPAQPGAVVLRQ